MSRPRTKPQTNTTQPKGERGKRLQRDADGLMPIERAFVAEYLLCHNGAQAYRKLKPQAKYPNVRANQLLKMPTVMQAIEAGRAQTAKKARMTLDDVVAELEKIALANLDDFTTLDPKTNRRYFDWAKLEALPPEERRAKMAALGELTIETMGGGNKPVVVKTKGKLLDKKGALVDLGKHLGGFVTRGELSGPNGGPVPIGGALLITDDPVQAAKAYQQMITGNGSK